jgi:hypothetical protein
VDRRRRVTVGLSTTYAISAYQRQCWEFDSRYREGYSRYDYVIKFVRNLRQVSGFLRVLRFSPPMQTVHHDTNEILLKVKLDTITLILTTQPDRYTIWYERKVIQA